MTDYSAANRDVTHEVAPDLAYKRLAIVNVMFFGLPGAGDETAKLCWVRVEDASLPALPKHEYP